MKYLFVSILLVFIGLPRLSAQTADGSVLRSAADSIRKADSLKKLQKTKDSLLLIARQDSARAADSIKKIQEERHRQIFANTQKTVREHPYFNVGKIPLQQATPLRKKENNDGIFYYIVGLVLYISLMRLFFYKYMSTMFTLFFRATLRQQQLREQLLQAPLPALLMNIFFVVSVATFCTLLAGHYQLVITGNFWTTLMYAVLLIAGVYLVKFIFLNMVGWIFGISNVTDTYIFIVFLINKMVGIFLLPFIALLAFPTPGLVPVVLMMSYILIGGMLFYRFIISYRPVRSEIKLNRFHFFLYICAFEIAPLLLIYKVLLAFVDSSL